MSSDLLRPPVSVSPPEALRRSQQAPTILQEPTFASPWPLSILTTSDSPEKWTIYENLFYSCMRTGDNRSAALCLKHLKGRFGETNERVMGMTGILHEGTAESQQRMEDLVKQYTDAIEEKPTNMVLRKRRVALFQSMGKDNLAITALNDILDVSPTDAEAWAELAELYFAQGLYPQAIYSLEEVLLVTPNAWNMHARLGEILYVAAKASSGDGIRAYTRSMKSFCRSIELCEDYLRGFYGLKLSTNTLRTILPDAKELVSRDVSEEEKFVAPSQAIVEKLNELATSKLAEIIRKYSTNQQNWTGYDEAEIIAARELLDRDSQTAPR